MEGLVRSNSEKNITGNEIDNCSDSDFDVACFGHCIFTGYQADVQLAGGNYQRGPSEN